MTIIDWANIDWATVDVTIIDWANIDMTTVDDGTRTQLQANIWDDTGSNSLTGPGTDHEVTFDDIDNFDDPAVDWLLTEPELTIDGVEVSVQGTFRDLSTGEERPGSFVGECGPGTRFRHRRRAARPVVPAGSPGMPARTHRLARDRSPHQLRVTTWPAAPPGHDRTHLRVF